MSLESFLSNQLQKFTILDFGLVKSVYFFIGCNDSPGYLIYGEKLDLSAGWTKI